VFDVTANNWLLPLSDEYFVVPSVMVRGLEIRMAHEVPVIFHGINSRTWWYSYWNKKNIKELKAACKGLGVRCNFATKAQYVDALAEYWRNRIDHISA